MAIDSICAEVENSPWVVPSEQRAFPSGFFTTSFHRLVPVERNHERCKAAASFVLHRFKVSIGGKTVIYTVYIYIFIQVV